MDKFIKVRAIATNTDHERMDFYVRVDTVVAISSCEAQYTKIGGACFIDTHPGFGRILCEESAEDVYNLVAKALK